MRTDRATERAGTGHPARAVWVAAVVAVVGVVGAVAPAAAVGTKAADERIAGAAIMVGTDLPAGWTATPSQTDRSFEKAAKKVRSCRSYVRYQALTDRQVKKRADDFGRDGASLTSTATVFPTAAAADRALTDLRSGDVAGCFDAVFEQRFAALVGPSVDPSTVVATFEEVPVDDLGDGGVAYGGSVGYADRAGAATAYGLLTILVRVGRVVNSYTMVAGEALVDVAEAALGQAVGQSTARTVTAQG